jgi:hypothetical protein
MFSNSAVRDGNKDEKGVAAAIPSPLLSDTSTAKTCSWDTSVISEAAVPTPCPRKTFPTVVPSLDYAVIEIDCEVLLSTMIEEASRVVGMVVERTNEAWAKSMQDQGLQSNEPALMAAGSDEVSSTVPGPPKPVNGSANEEGISNKVASVSRSPNLGAKKVSEVSFDPLKLEGAEDLQNDDNKKPASSFSPLWDCRLEDSDSDDDCKLQFEGSEVDPRLNHQHVDFSDEENLNPFISAEKASHIVDYVFGELDDEIIVVPHRPTKKARIDDC